MDTTVDLSTIYEHYPQACDRVNDTWSQVLNERGVVNIRPARYYNNDDYSTIARLEAAGYAAEEDYEDDEYEVVEVPRRRRPRFSPISYGQEYEPEEEEQDDRLLSETVSWWAIKVMSLKRYYQMVERIEELEEQLRDTEHELSISSNSDYQADAKLYAQNYHNVCRQLAEQSAKATEWELKCRFYENMFDKLLKGEIDEKNIGTFRDADGKIRSVTGRTKAEQEDRALQMYDDGVSKSAIMRELQLTDMHSVDTYISSARSRKRVRADEMMRKYGGPFTFQNAYEWWTKKTISREQLLDMADEGTAYDSDDRIALKADDDLWYSEDRINLKSIYHYSA